MTTLRAEVFEALVSGRTVASVCAVAAVPRLTVVRLGRDAGLRYNPGTDRFTVPEGFEAPAPRSRSLAELVQQGETSDRQRTRSLAARARTVVLELERAVLADTARRAAGEYPVKVVRQWAREQGLDVPSHGRYLPAHIVQAWFLAGEPDGTKGE